MNILVIGGEGFIGRNLVKRLYQEGHKITVVDNYRTSSPSGNGLLKGIKVIKKDWLCDKIHIRKSGWDRVYYLASLPSPKSYKEEPIETLSLGFYGLDLAMDYAYYSDCPIFIASSSEVYGNTKSEMVETNYGSVNPYGERSCYDESKRVMEALAHAYLEEYGVDVRIGRIFNTYGPGMAMDGRVFTQFIKAAYNDEPIEIYRSGTITRSPCYIDDLLDQIEILMSTDRSNHPEVNEPTNLGNDIEYTLKDIASLVLENNPESTSKIKIIKDGTDKDDPTKRKPNLTKIRSLGYNPEETVSLLLGLYWLQANLEARELI